MPAPAADLPMTSASARRSKRYRARLRDNRVILPVEVDLFGVTDALIENGMISEAASEDRALVAAAIAELVEAWAKNSVMRDATGAGQACT